MKAAGTRRRVAWLLGLWLLCAGPVLAQAGRPLPENIAYADTPAWVQPIDTGALAPAEASGGVAYRLVDDQVSLLGPQPVEYRRLAYDVVDREGLEEAGRLRIGFHPDYQRVQVHGLVVVREGRREDRRPQALVELLRLEERADEGILDGRRTAELLLTDVRVGDRVELSFSVTGDNPVFGGDYHSGFWAGYSQGTALRRLRLLAPAGRPLRWRNTGVGYTVSDRIEGDRQELVFTARDLPAIASEDDSPAWFDGYGRIEVSTARDWADVAGWAERLFRTDAAARRGLAEQARLLGLGGREPAEVLHEALAFVQREVRYVSLSIGESSHAPASPVTTLARRYGDCKDKSLLLVGLLAEAGVPAEPVLVHSDLRGHVRDRLPSAVAFDHAIVRARLDGRWVYVDPTRNTELGDFDERAPVDFGAGLPVAADVEGLADIPSGEPGEPSVVVMQDVGLHEGEGGPLADFRIRTTYRHGFAAGNRARFHSDGAEEVGRGYLDYMQGLYRDIRQVSPPETLDEPADNRLHVEEHYRAGFTPDEDSPRAIGELELRLFQLADWVPAGREPERRWPLALDGPSRGVQEIRMTLEGGWDIEAEDESVGNDYFRFRRTVSLDGEALVVRGEWQRLADAIPAADYAGLRADLHAVRDLLVFPVRIGAPGGEGPALAREDLAWPGAALLGTLLLLGALWPVRRTSQVAGMFFAPRLTAEGVIAQRGPPSAIALLIALGLLTVAMDAVPELLAGRSPAWGGLLFMALVAVPQNLVAVALLYLAFRLLQSRPPYRDLLVAVAWAGWPSLLLVPLALVAAGPALVVLADSSRVPQGEPLVLVAMGAGSLLLALLAIGWTLASVVGAAAAAARCGIGRSLLANLMLMAAAFVLVLAVVLVMIFNQGGLPGAA